MIGAIALWLSLVVARGSLADVLGPVDQAARTATGFASHLLCDEVCITRTTRQRALDDRIRPMPTAPAPCWCCTTAASRASAMPPGSGRTRRCWVSR